MLKGVSCQYTHLGVYIYVHTHIYTNTINHTQHTYTHTTPSLAASTFYNSSPHFQKKVLSIKDWNTVL